MDKRTYTTSRETLETSIKLKLALDGGQIDIRSGSGFLDHMLTLFARHGGFGLELECKGDTFIDFHHSAEDIGIILGQAFYEAAGNKEGVNRYGFFLLPMDEALIETAVDFGGRVFFAYDAPFHTEKVGSFDTELVEEFWRAFVNNAKINLHITKKAGTNSHHIAEGIFKSVARSLKMALQITGKGIMSTKGILG